MSVAGLSFLNDTILNIRFQFIPNRPKTYIFLSRDDSPFSSVAVVGYRYHFVGTRLSWTSKSSTYRPTSAFKTSVYDCAYIDTTRRAREKDAISGALLSRAVRAHRASTLARQYCICTRTRCR